MLDEQDDSEEWFVIRSPGKMDTPDGKYSLYLPLNPFMIGYPASNQDNFELRENTVFNAVWYVRNNLSSQAYEPFAIYSTDQHESTQTIYILNKHEFFDEGYYGFFDFEQINSDDLPMFFNCATDDEMEYKMNCKMNWGNIIHVDQQWFNNVIQRRIIPINIFF